MLARLEEARSVVADVHAEYRERGNLMDLAQGAGLAASVELLAGNAARAEDYLSEGCVFLEQQGAKGVVATLAAQRALVLYQLDRLEEAEAWAAKAAELGDGADMSVQIPWRRAQAKVLARRGDQVRGERLFREALALADSTDSLNDRADAYA